MQDSNDEGAVATTLAAGGGTLSDKAIGGQIRDWSFAIVPAAMLAILLLRPTTNSDMFWQLKLGELTLAQMGPVWTEPFSAPHLGEPLQNLAWLGQGLFALVHKWSGWAGLRLFDALCWLGGFWAAAYSCRRAGWAPLAISAGLGLAFVAALPTAILRPQSYASLCFGSLLFLLSSKASVRSKVALGAVLLLVWQNLHPSVGAGIVVLGISGAVGWLRWWRARNQAMPVVETILLPIAVAAMFCTPDGFSILEISARNSELSMMIGVGEWLPLWAPVNGQLAIPVAIVALIAVILSLRNVRQLDLRETAICLAFLVLTLLVYRFVLFWAIALVPLIARIAGPVSENAEPVQAKPDKLLGKAIFAIVAVALVVSIARPVTFREHIPIAALERLRGEGVKGTIFSDFPLGGPIIYVGHPDWKVAYDGRYFRYTRDEWLWFAAVQSGQVKLGDIICRHQPAAFVLAPARNAKLLGELEAAPDAWRRTWKDRNVAIFVPSGPPLTQPDGCQDNPG